MIAEITTAVSSVKTAYEIAKGMSALKELMGNTEAKMKIVELMDTLVKAKSDLVEIKEKLVEKDNTIIELKKQLSLKDSIIFEEPFYWKKLEGDAKDGPYCAKCYDVSGKLIRLIKKSGYSTGSHQCFECQNWYGKGEDYDDAPHFNYV